MKNESYNIENLSNLNLNKIIDEIISTNLEASNLDFDKIFNNNDFPMSSSNNEYKDKNDSVNEKIKNLTDKFTVFKNDFNNVNFDNTTNKVSFSNEEVLYLIDLLSEDNKKLENELEKYEERYRNMDSNYKIEK